MQVRLFTAWTEKGFDRKLNVFLARKDIEVKEIKFKPSFGVPMALVIFEEI